MGEIWNLLPRCSAVCANTTISLQDKQDNSHDWIDGRWQSGSLNERLEGHTVIGNTATKQLHTPNESIYRPARTVSKSIIKLLQQ